MILQMEPTTSNRWLGWMSLKACPLFHNVISIAP